MASKRRLIDAWKLVIDLAKLENSGEYDSEKVLAVIASQNTIDAVEVVHGEWSIIEDDYCGMTALQCSKCNQEYWFEDDPPTRIYNYCPNCGAKIDGDWNG